MMEWQDDEMTGGLIGKHVISSEALNAHQSQAICGNWESKQKKTVIFLTIYILYV